MNKELIAQVNKIRNIAFDANGKPIQIGDICYDSERNIHIKIYRIESGGTVLGWRIVDDEITKESYYTQTPGTDIVITSR